MKNNFLSIDLEDWHTSAYLRESVTSDNYSSRINATTQLILDLFNKLNVKATFFVLGSIVKEHPSLIERIYAQGHEIASHGYSHTPLWDLNKESFEEEIVQTNELLKNLLGVKAIGFRAPYASLRQDTAWAIDVLKKEGFVYDSSIFPMKTPLYGVKNAPVDSYYISATDITKNDPKSSLLEIPFTVFKSSLIDIPCTGGIYSRFLPFFMQYYLFKKIEKKRPINFYFHPWEIDPAIPKIKVPLYNRIVSYYNVKHHLNTVEKIVSAFPFSSFQSILDLKE